MSALVLRREVEHCAVLELNVPERGNALSAVLVRELRKNLNDIFSALMFDTVVITGAGRHLCTGFDLGGIEKQSDGDLLHRFVEIELLLAELWHAPIRTAALAKGKTWGAGADIFAACDYRIAQPATTFRFPGSGFGIVLGTRRLCARVGEGVARRWIAGNEEVAAGDAAAASLATALTELDSAESWIAEELPALRVQRGTLDDLYRASRPDLRDADLAHLVRSAVREGLRDRIMTYVNGDRSTRGSGR